MAGERETRGTVTRSRRIRQRDGEGHLTIRRFDRNERASRCVHVTEGNQAPRQWREQRTGTLLLLTSIFFPNFISLSLPFLPLHQVFSFILTFFPCRHQKAHAAEIRLHSYFQTMLAVTAS